MSLNPLHLASIVLGIAGCAQGPTPTKAASQDPLPDGSQDTASAAEQPTDDVDPLAELSADDALQLLARLSLDLRGVRPTLSEITRVQADPGAIPDLIDEMLWDPRFPGQMAGLWNAAISTRVWGASYDRFGELSWAQWRAMGQEPLQVVELVIRDDLPFSDLVTAQQVPTHADLASVYGTTGGATWAWGSYGDDRPMAGILTTNALWLRYTADAVNGNRTRANALSRIFLCADLLDRDGDVSFDVDASDLASLERAVQTVPACVTCHAPLDPLARFFAGFAQKSDNHPVERYVHYSAFEHKITLVGGERPAYFGHPAEDLEDLGELVAADPRFWRCSTRRFAEGLLHEDVTEELIDELSPTFRGEDGDVRALVRAVVTSPDYRQRDRQLMRVEQLYTALSDLGGVGSDTELDAGLERVGWDPEHRVLGGGTDDVTVLSPNPVPTVGLAVLQAWAGRKLAAEVVPRDLAADTDGAVLLTDVTSTTTEEETIRAQLATLHTRMLTTPVDPTDDQVDSLYQLWSDVAAITDRQTAWEAVVAALVRHPHAVLY